MLKTIIIEEFTQNVKALHNVLYPDGRLVGKYQEKNLTLASILNECYKFTGVGTLFTSRCLAFMPLLCIFTVWECAIWILHRTQVHNEIEKNITSGHIYLFYRETHVKELLIH